MHRPTLTAFVLGLALALSACTTPPTEGPEAGAPVIDESELTNITESDDDLSIVETPGEPGGIQLTPEEQAQVDLAETGDRVFFDYDKSSFGAEGEATLRAQGELLQQASELTVTIEGHCDERGTREYNIALGERRAEAVKTYLVSLGIEASRISTISYGKERPQVAGHSEEPWHENRVAITVINP